VTGCPSGGALVLGWCCRGGWAPVGPAGQLRLWPGWIARDAKDSARGWAFGVDQPSRRQIGALVAEDADAAERLLSAAASDDLEVLAFVRASDVVTPELWRAHGFAVQPYSYMVAPTRTAASADSPTTALPSWTPSDGHDTAKLLARAYANDTGLRPFAREGTDAEWHDYVAAVTLRPGCGEFSSQASATHRAGDALVGVALVTSIGRTTAHLAQLAIDPSARGRGLSRTLMSAVRANADRVLGASRVSLLVSGASRAALAVYAREGFRPVATFLAAHRPALNAPECPRKSGVNCIGNSRGINSRRFTSPCGP